MDHVPRSASNRRPVDRQTETTAETSGGAPRRYISARTGRRRRDRVDRLPPPGKPEICQASSRDKSPAAIQILSSQSHGKSSQRLLQIKALFDQRTGSRAHRAAGTAKSERRRGLGVGLVAGQIRLAGLIDRGQQTVPSALRASVKTKIDPRLRRSRPRCRCDGRSASAPAAGTAARTPPVDQQVAQIQHDGGPDIGREWSGLRRKIVGVAAQPVQRRSDRASATWASTALMLPPFAHQRSAANCR